MIALDLAAGVRAVESEGDAPRVYFDATAGVVLGIDVKDQSLMARLSTSLQVGQYIGKNGTFNLTASLLWDWNGGPAVDVFLIGVKVTR